MKKLLSTILFIGSLYTGMGQDIHFSQFYRSPLMLNPALTGDYKGDWRFTGNQRSQWRAVSRAYNTFGFSVENNEGKIKPNLFYGLNYMNDVAGDGNYRTHELNVSVAQQFLFKSVTAQKITVGAQFGINHKAIDFNAFQYDLQFNGYKYDPNLPSNEIFSNQRYTNVNSSLGVFYARAFKSELKIETGVAAFNLIGQKQGFLGNPSIVRDRRFVVHANAVYPINFQWDLMPGLLFQTQGVYRELNLGANIRYVQLDKKGEYIAPYAGVWFRAKDAVNIVAGLYYNNWIAGISYDVNISALSPASNVRGGLELSFQYILDIFKPKNIQYRICPDFL